jgi:hypothetical protein
MTIFGLLLVSSVFGYKRKIANHVYVEDPKHSFHHEFFSDDLIVGQNSRWIEKLYYQPRQGNFVDSMININSTIPLSPQIALQEKVVNKRFGVLKKNRFPTKKVF